MVRLSGPTVAATLALAALPAATASVTAAVPPPYYGPHFCAGPPYHLGWRPGFYRYLHGWDGRCGRGYSWRAGGWHGSYAGPRGYGTDR